MGVDIPLAKRELGELYIGLDYVQRSFMNYLIFLFTSRKAMKNNLNIDHELLIVINHGVHHLLGHTHRYEGDSKRMLKEENQTLEELERLERAEE